MKNLSESIMKNLKESSDNDRIVKVRIDEDRDIDDFLVESVSRNSRRVSKSVSHNLNTKSRRKSKKLNESSILDVDGSSDLNDIMESDEVMYIINVYGNADIDVGQIIHDYTSNLMRLDIDAVKKALSNWASDIREHMGDM